MSKISSENFIFSDYSLLDVFAKVPEFFFTTDLKIESM